MAHHSFPRLSQLDPNGMSAAQVRLYKSITEGPRASGQQLFDLIDKDGGLLGPFQAMLQSPELGEAVQGVGAVLRYKTGLTSRVREITVLAVAAAWTSSFEAYAHEAVGRHVGVTDTEIASLRAGEIPYGTDPSEVAVLAAAGGLVKRCDLTDEEYTAALEHVGEAGIFELVTLVGYYMLLALQMRIFRIEAPTAAS
jgi:4-carboxymuconolactone decarboxylase